MEYFKSISKVQSADHLLKAWGRLEFYPHYFMIPQELLVINPEHKARSIL